MSRTPPQAENAHRQRGWWIPYTFVAGFAVVLAANGAMLYFALSSFSGLSTKQAYVEGLAYNDRVAEEEAQAALGWTWDLDLAAVEPLEPNGLSRVATLRADGRGAEGTPLDGLSVTATIRRPTEQGLDQTLPLRAVGPGLYETRLTLAKPGQWDVLVSAHRGEDVFRLRRRLLVE
jgi:nitrogen fixation protein FixH